MRNLKYSIYTAWSISGIIRIFDAFPLRNRNESKKKRKMQITQKYFRNKITIQWGVWDGGRGGGCTLLVCALGAKKVVNVKVNVNISHSFLSL